MKRTLLTLLLLSPLAFAEEPLDCTDPVTQFVKPEICNKVNENINEKEDEIYWCYVVSGFYYKEFDDDDKEKLEKGTAEEKLQKFWYQTFNMATYSAYKAYAYEAAILPQISDTEIFENVQKKYKTYANKIKGTGWPKEITKFANCMIDAPDKFLSDKQKHQFSQIEEDIWIDALQKRDADNKVDGIDIELWVENTKPLRNKKYNAERWKSWLKSSALLSGPEGKISGIPAFDWAKQNYCMEIYGNFDCKE